jgi:hypothetical protein
MARLDRHPTDLGATFAVDHRTLLTIDRVDGSSVSLAHGRPASRSPRARHFRRLGAPLGPALPIRRRPLRRDSPLPWSRRTDDGRLAAVTDDRPTTTAGASR